MLIKFMLSKRTIMHSLACILLLLSVVCLNEVNGGEQCIDKDGHPYYCNGFCCAGIGCCSYSNLWYAWALLALVVIACLCGCASCSMRRYHLAYRQSSAPSQYRRLSSVANGQMSDRNRTRTGGGVPGGVSGRLVNYPRATYSSVNERSPIMGQEYRHYGSEMPPPYPNSSAPPPPYSERL